MNTEETEKRIEKARNLHHSGRNCCQSVVLAYADMLDMGETALSDIAKPFGRGLSGLGEVCGCVSGMAMICGLTGNSDKTKLLAEIFRNTNGDINCGRLLKQGRKPCSELVSDAVRILGENIF